MKYHVYWIHLKSHTNPYTEGYIGKTCNLTARFKSYDNSSKRVEYKLFSVKKRYIK